MVRVSSLSTADYKRTGLAAGFAEACDRLVAPVVVGSERAMQVRFVASLLVAPFALAMAWPMVAAAATPSVATMALGLFFCVAWSMVAWVASKGSTAVAAPLALGAAVPPVAVVLAVMGGFATPALLLAGALAVEAWWTLRTTAALKAGLAATAAVIVLQIPLAGLGLSSSGFAAWHWLLPAAYGLTVWTRLPSLLRRDEEAPAQVGVEDVMDCAVLALSGNGDVLDTQGPVRTLVGLGPEMLLDGGFFDRIHVGDRVAYLTALADARDGRDTADLQLRLRMAGQGGAHRAFSVSFRRLDRIYAVIRDDSDRADMRAQIEVLRDAADEAGLAKARFLSTVSHELRTPLNAIIGFADMLAMDMAGPLSDPRQKAYATLIRESGDHLLGLVNAILDVSKIDAGSYTIRPEPFDVADAAAASHAMLSLQAREKQITLENGVTAAAGSIDADRRAVQQILVNLLSNAVKFTPAGGCVRMDARRRGRYLTLEVSDNGIGIGPTDLARLCRPFAQVQNDYTRQYDGAGLGLSIAKGLVELHHGSMSIESAEGEGTIVTVTLPVETRVRVPVSSSFPEEGHAPIRKSA